MYTTINSYYHAHDDIMSIKQMVVVYFIGEKSIQEQKGPGCSKTFIHDGESYELMMINSVYSKRTGKMTKFKYM